MYLFVFIFLYLALKINKSEDYCLGNQGDVNFQTSLQKHIITAALYILLIHYI